MDGFIAALLILFAASCGSPPSPSDPLSPTENERFAAIENHLVRRHCRRMEAQQLSGLGAVEFHVEHRVSGRWYVPVLIGSEADQVHLSLDDRWRRRADARGSQVGLTLQATRGDDAWMIHAEVIRGGARYALFECSEDPQLAPLLGNSEEPALCGPHPGPERVSSPGTYARASSPDPRWLAAADAFQAQALIDAAPVGAPVVRRDGAPVWIDLRDHSSWPSLAEVSGAVTVVLDAATAELLADRLTELTACAPVLVTWIVEPGLRDLSPLRSLDRIEGLHLIAAEHRALTTEQLSLADDLAVLALDEVELPLGEVSTPHILSVRCAGCRIEALPLAPITLLDVAEVTEEIVGRFRTVDPEMGVDTVLLRAGGRELLRRGVPTAVFGEIAERDESALAALDPRLRTLIDGRVGEDLFSIGDDRGEGREVTRLCGDAARVRSAQLGEAWRCARTGCTPDDGCPGNGCAFLAFDGDVLLSEWSGASMGERPRLSPATARRLRTEMDCGETRALPASSLR